MSGAVAAVIASLGAAASTPYAFVSKTTPTGSGSVAVTINSGESIIVQVFNEGSSSATFSVTDTLSNTYTEAVKRAGTFSPCTGAIWYCMAPGTTGSTTISVSGGTNITVYKYTGLSSYSVSNSSYQRPAPTSADAVTTGTMTPGSQPAMQFTFAIGAGLTSLTINGAFNDRGDVARNFFGFGASGDRRLTSTSAVAATYTAGAGGEVISLASVFVES